MDSNALLATLEKNALAASHVGREAVRVGPFVALLHEGTDLVWLNHAMPVDPIGTAAEIGAVCTELRAVFRRRARTLRFEFMGALWPQLPAALEDAGLVLQARQPILVANAETFRPRRAPGVEVKILDGTASDAVLDAQVAVVTEAFGESLGATNHDAQRKALASGAQVLAVAFEGGDMLGSAMLTPAGGLTEMVGVGTVKRGRRRGVAATVCSELTRHWLSRGGEAVWLSAGDEAATRLYESLGFAKVGELVNYIDAAP